jgi:hypothetical protein
MLRYEWIYQRDGDNAHEGVETTSENDSPVSSGWEYVGVKDMAEAGKDAFGYAAYRCSVCGKAMQIVKP